MRGIWLVLALAGCGFGSAAPLDPSQFDPQLPPTGDLDLKGWLREGFYESWNCESSPSEPRPTSPHGRNRVCRNEVLATRSEGELPEGAAAVQELWSTGDLVLGFTVSRKVHSGNGGDSWYWYERVRSLVYTDGEAVRACSACHALAGDQHSGADFVFIR